MKYLTYLVYIVIYETFCLGGAVYLKLTGHSWWWIILGVYLSSAAYSPSRWGLTEEKEEKSEKHIKVIL